MDHGGASGLPTRRLAVGERSAVGREVVRVVVHLGLMLEPSSSVAVAVARASSSTLASLGLGEETVEKKKKKKEESRRLGEGGL